jgi:epoxyqueuosine reductase
MAAARRASAPTDPLAIREAIRAEALALGFASAGFAAAAAPSVQRERLDLLLDAGGHGDMDWLARTPDRRADPVALWPQARTALSLAMNYAPTHDPLTALEDKSRGVVSVYAHGRDYHDIVKARLKRLGRWIGETWASDLKVFVDTAPVMEKPLAQRAGVGWQGKHTNLVSRTHGSWLFLGEILLPLALPPDQAEADHCGSCRACLDICPTAAFPEPYRLDPRRCISYLTIEHKGPIPRALRAAMGNRVYGCDDCLAVCPWNKFAQAASESGFAARPGFDASALVELAALDDAAFRARFAGSPIKRTGRDRFVRNVAVALGNAGVGDATVAATRRLLDDESALVRGAAAWAAARTMSTEAFDRERTLRLPNERDDSVRTEWIAS